MSASNSLPGSRSSSIGSSGRGRPVPTLPSDTAAEDTNTGNGISGQTFEEDSDSDVRRHHPSSNPRTQFTSQTPASEKAAMHNLKAKMTFSDNSAPSSTASTPNKSHQPHPFPPQELTRGAMTDPSKLQNIKQHPMKLLTQSATPTIHRLAMAQQQVNGDGQSDDGSEGEIDSSVTISTLLSKLDSVRNFLKEAEILHLRFQGQSSEPGVPEQLAKLEKLIAELKEQESSHLGVLLAVMAASELKDGGLVSKEDLELSEDEESEEEGDSEGGSDSGEEDDPANQTVIKATNDDSLSLRAQIEQRRQETADKEEELVVLRQQQELLKKLLDQQKQIRELEMRQAALLRMKEQAQEQIAEAEFKSAEIHRLSGGALDEEKQQEMKVQDEEEGVKMASEQPATEARSGEEQKSPPPPATTSLPPPLSLSSGGAQGKEREIEERMEQLALDNKISEPSSASQDQLLLMRIAELRARKEKVERLVGLLSSMKLEGTGEAAQEEKAATNGGPLLRNGTETPELLTSSNSRRTEEPSQINSQAKGGGAATIGLSAEATIGHGRPSELVHDDEVTGMADLQEKIRKAEEARKKLRELQEMISQLHDYSPDNSEQEDKENTSLPEQLQWRLSERQANVELGQRRAGAVPLSADEDSDDEAEDDEAGNETMNTTLTEDLDPVERSLVEQYQNRLSAKKREVVELQRRRDELRRTHDRLILLQSQLLSPAKSDVEVKSKPTVKGQPRRNRAEEKALDTTTATWGGSTLPSEIEEGEKSPGSGSSVSLPSAILADMTQDSILPNASALAGSASVEQRGASQGKPPFKVTRHTPRNVSTQRPYRMRTISSPTDQSQTKKRKLDSRNVSIAAWQQDSQDVPRPTNPDPYATTAFFPSPQQRVTGLHDMSHMTTDSSSQYFTSMLYSQLAMASNMCSELLHTQNNLVGAVCSHLEMIGYQAGIQQHQSALFHYQKELEQYYHELYQRYSQLAQQQPSQGSGGFQSSAPQTEPEEPVGSVNGQQFDGGTQGSTGRGTPPVNEMPGSSSAQLHEGASWMPPPPPSLSAQPNPFHFRGYSGQPTGGDVSFAASAEAAATASGGGNPGLSAPPAPPTFSNPYLMPFHSPHYYGLSPMSRSYGNGFPFGMGFAPPPHFGNGSFSPTPQFAPVRPNLFTGYPSYRSPMPYPRHHNWSHHSPRAAMFGSPGQAPQFAPPFPHPPPPLGVPHFPFMNPLPPFAHHPPSAFAGHLHSQAPPPFPPGPASNLSTSFAERGNLRPSTLLPAQANLRDDHLGFHSPSGITAASIQVQPPSSPPSVPSVNLQQSSTNQNNCNATSTAMPKLEISESSTMGLMPSVPNPNSLGAALQYSTFPPTGGTVTASPLTQASFMAPGSKTSGGAVGPFLFSTSAQNPSFGTKVNQPSGFDGSQGWKTGTTATASGTNVEQGTVDIQKSKLEEEESLSSLPVSIPEELRHLRLDALEDELLLSREPRQEKKGEGDEEGAALAASGQTSAFSVFDALRETIYSEVATFIANNEARPHFLVELFRELQMLSTDYLRQRALYNLQDLVTRYLTEEGVAEEAKAMTTTANMFQGWATGSLSERTPSESGVTTEEETNGGSKPPLAKTNSQKYDYVEPVHSASSLSTPPHSSSFSDEPFALDSLGATAVRLDKEMAKIKAKVVVGVDDGASPLGLRPPIVSPGPLKTANEDFASDVNTEQLDELIKMIMIEVIPIFKENLESTCTPEILAQIKQIIIGLVAEQEKINEKQELFDAFTKQLEGAINAASEKFTEKLIKDCGEDLLVEISEVLFNELTFFRLLKDFKGHPQLGAELDSTAENEEYEGEDKLQPPSKAAAPLSAANSGQPWDPVLLQALCLVANNANLAEEEEALGKSRDDDLAISWDKKIQEHDRSSLSADEDGASRLVELSLSESRPLNSAGSGEEDNAEPETAPTALDSAQPPPPLAPAQFSNDDDLREATPTPIGATQPDPNQPASKDAARERSGETPPTPLATEAEPSADPNEAAAQSVETREKEEGGGERDKAVVSSDENKNEDALSDGGCAQEEGREAAGIEQATGIGEKEAQSPTCPAPGDQQPGLTGINEEELEAQMKKEQQSTEGVAGILASIEEKGPLELAGDGNELATPSPNYVEA